MFTETCRRSRRCYVLLDAGDAGSPPKVHVQFVRVTYDVEAAARGITEAGLPEEFAEFLRTGGAVHV